VVVTDNGIDEGIVASVDVKPLAAGAFCACFRTHDSKPHFACLCLE
jgi:hypothetical protein